VRCQYLGVKREPLLGSEDTVVDNDARSLALLLSR
jgi:hypothetical protein